MQPDTSNYLEVESISAGPWRRTSWRAKSQILCRIGARKGNCRKEAAEMRACC